MSNESFIPLCDLERFGAKAAALQGAVSDFLTAFSDASVNGLYYDRAKALSLIRDVSDCTLSLIVATNDLIEYV